MKLNLAILQNWAEI